MASALARYFGFGKQLIPSPTAALPRPQTPPTPALGQEVQDLYRGINPGILQEVRLKFGDIVVRDLGKRIEAFRNGQDPSQIVLTESPSWIIDAVLSVQRTLKATTSLDESKQEALLFLNALDGEIRSLYAKIDGALLKRALDRFGPAAIRDLARLIDAGHASLAAAGDGEPGWLGSLKQAALGIAADSIVDKTTLKSNALSLLLNVADKAQAALPDGKSKQAFVEGMAFELESALSQIVSAQERANKTRAKTHDLRVKALNVQLQPQLRDKDVFYEKLAGRILVRYKTELLSGAPSIVALIGKYATTDALKRDKIKLGLLKVHGMLTDPIFIKKMVAKFALNLSSEAMERIFNRYMEALESPLSTPPSTPVLQRSAAGKAVVDILKFTNPLFLASLYQGLFGDAKLQAGTDPLSALLSDLIDSLLKEQMQPGTDDWLAGLLSILRVNLLDAGSEMFSDCPAYIFPEDWNGDMADCRPSDIPPDHWEVMSVHERKADAIKPDRVERYKALYKEKVEARFLIACQRIGRNAARCGLVFEQFLQTARQAAQDSRRYWLTRAVAYLFACILAVPGLKIIFEILHRLIIYIRSKIADFAGDRVGKKLAQEASLLFESQAMDILLMKAFEEGLERLRLIDPRAPSPTLAAPALFVGTAGGATVSAPMSTASMLSIPPQDPLPGSAPSAMPSAESNRLPLWQKVSEAVSGALRWRYRRALSEVQLTGLEASSRPLGASASAVDLSEIASVSGKVHANSAPQSPTSPSS